MKPIPLFIQSPHKQEENVPPQVTPGLHRRLSGSPAFTPPLTGKALKDLLCNWDLCLHKNSLRGENSQYLLYFVTLHFEESMEKEKKK